MAAFKTVLDENQIVSQVLLSGMLIYSVFYNQLSSTVIK